MFQLLNLDFKEYKMKRSLGELEHFFLETKDGIQGRIKDFLFDEKRWVVHYLDVKFKGIEPTERVLVPRVFLDIPIWKYRKIPAELVSDKIERCPKIGSHLPISRKYEEELNKHYQVVPYWSAAYFGPVGTYYPPRPIEGPFTGIEEDNLGSILRSFNQVKGYHVETVDGRLGHIDDLIIDDSDWQIVYAIMDTSNWLPFSKKVMIAVSWMDKISYVDRNIRVKLNKETIKKAREYYPHLVRDEDFEKNNYDYYSMSLDK